MPIYDVSLPISESLVTWPSDPPVRVTQVFHLERGDKATVTRLVMGAHTGTHVDAPCHFILGGAGVDTLDLDVLVGPALVVEVLEAAVLTAEVLAGLPIPPASERVLLHTRNSDLWARDEDGRTIVRPFAEDFVGVSEDGARWLIERGVRLVGVDYLSVAPFGESAPTHQALLRAGVVVVEGLNLDGIAPGAYRLVCLPLKIVGGDGAPARAILITGE
jgi:arylformamidase